MIRLRRGRGMLAVSILLCSLDAHAPQAADSADGRSLDQFLEEIRSSYQQRDWKRHFSLYDASRLEEIASGFRRQVVARSSNGNDLRLVDFFDVCDIETLDRLSPTDFMIRFYAWMSVMLCELPPSPFEPGTRVGESRDGDLLSVFFLPDKAQGARRPVQRAITVIETSEGLRYRPDEEVVRALDAALQKAIKTISKSTIVDHRTPSQAAPGAAKLEDTETPPIPVSGDVFPPKLVSKVQPGYPDAARLAQRVGRVAIKAVIETDGSVTCAKVLQAPSPSFGLVREAIATVRQWRFEPATLYGVPVRVYFTIVVDFSVRPEPTPECL